VTPVTAFYALSWLGRLSRVNAAATAAHYGSVSAVTFLAAIEASKVAGSPADGYLPALVAVLEVPGIVVGLLLASQRSGGGMNEAVREVVTGKSIFLLIGGMVIGALCGPVKIDAVAPLFIDPFKGVLCLFYWSSASSPPDVSPTSRRRVGASCLSAVCFRFYTACSAPWLVPLQE
jgi:hypothetical protein